MKKLLPLVAAAAFVLLPSQDAHAQVGVDFGPELNYNNESEDFGLGARLEISPPLFPVGFIVNGLYIFRDCDPIDCTALEFNASGKYTITLPGSPLGPYFGAGVTHQRISFSGFDDFDDTGFHVIGGLGLGGFLPIGAFVEGRYLIMDENQFAISLGILF